MIFDKLQDIKSNWKAKEFRTKVYLSFCFFLMTYFSCCYTNAAAIYNQNIAMILISIALACCMIGFYPKERVINRNNAVIGIVVLVVAAISVFQCYPNGEHIKISAALCAAVYLWIIVGKIEIKDIRSKGMRHISPYFICIWCMMLVSLVFFGNSRTWPLMLLIPVTFFLLHEFNKEEKKTFIESMSSGIIACFWVLTILALLFRPFDKSRYYGIFRTVCHYSFFLCMVVVAVMIQMQNAMQRTKSIWKLMPHFANMGIVLGFIILSGTRSAFAALIVVIPGYFLLTHRALPTGKRGNIWKKLGTLVLCTAVALPILFLAVRYVPGILHHPYWFEGEYSEERSVHSYDTLDSDRYTSVKEYTKTIAQKVGAEEVKKEDTLYEDYTNGRVDIYTTYFKNLNLEGHDSTEIVIDDNTTYVHSHNSYLNMFYEFGIFTGIVFLMYCAYVFALSIMNYKRNCKTDIYAFVPLAIIVMFGITGLTETNVYPGYPMGLFFYLVQNFIVKKENK